MKLRNRFLSRLTARIVVWMLRGLFKTCRFDLRLTVEGTCPYDDTGEERYLYCIWHDQIAMVIFSGRPKRMAGLVSRHTDASLLSTAMSLLGILPVQGSSGRRSNKTGEYRQRGGAQAMRKLLETAEEHHVAVTPDGPRGPRREMKSGIVFLASQTGRKIVPVACSARRAWRIKAGWTDLMVPKPFTRTFGLAGEPISIPADLDKASTEQWTNTIQTAMDELHDRVDRLAEGREQGDAASEPALKTAA